jgi:hypothetical protein
MLERERMELNRIGVIGTPSYKRCRHCRVMMSRGSMERVGVRDFVYGYQCRSRDACDRRRGSNPSVHEHAPVRSGRLR